MKVLILSGIWCGDCVQQCPLLVRLAESRADLLNSASSIETCTAI